ncbi:MAG: caspase family protein, partial [Chloroflexi bacterium]|nr:caspase family protein [Chloroflexota bacterium]
LQVNDTNGTGDDFTRFEKQGIGVIVVLVNSFDSHGTIPAPAQYDEFAQRCTETVAQSTGARIWVIGREPNAAFARPNGKAITPEEYARCFNRCRRAIRAVAGHANDWVVPAAIAPQNIETTYPGNPTGDWVNYFADVLTQIHTQGGGMDALALHVLGSNQMPDDLRRAVLLPPPFTKNHQGFQAYRDFIAAIPLHARNLPILIAETSPTNARGQVWENRNRGWIQAAFEEINAWNADATRQPIIALCLFQWQHELWGISDKPKLIADLRAALKNEYRVRMPGEIPVSAREPRVAQVETPAQTTIPQREISEAGVFNPDNAFALVIGIPGALLGRRVPVASKDAIEIASVLTDPALCGYRPENVRRLLDQEATRANILDSLTSLARQAKPDSTVLIYFVGAAVSVAQRSGTVNYLIPADAQTPSDPRFVSTLIFVADLNRALRKIRARVLLLLDTISSVIGDETSEMPRPVAIGEEIVPTVSVLELARMSEGRSARDIGHSLAYYLLQALRGDVFSRDGMIRVKDLADFVRARMQQEKPQQSRFNAVTGPNFAMALYRGGSAGVQATQTSRAPYLDFDVKIRPAPDGKGYIAHIQSPAGEVETRFENPITDLELENFLLRMQPRQR